VTPSTSALEQFHARAIQIVRDWKKAPNTSYYAMCLIEVELEKLNPKKNKQEGSENA
jgi:hypothetical protein